MACNRLGQFIVPFEVDSPTFGVRVAFTSEVSALNSLAYEDTVYLYAGSHQTIEQYYFTADNLLVSIRNITTKTNEQVNKIKFSPDGEYLYALSPTHVVKVKASLDCSTATSCSECVVSFLCGWCQLDFTCTGQNSSCTNGQWLNVQNQGTDTTNTCPYLQPNSDTSDGKYTQPANVTKNLTISTINTVVSYNYILMIIIIILPILL
ncbi:PREDICTED: uncharacterized protein LOC109582261 [Amphimedon queenslandica]|uniref:Sema domain-containing protein n=1 Tax=Amphimedon queenslandica TaxID=400682 RepID=A0AAN0J6T4_AMPQE|nr:PREDICTED: uncharacterized protein LOC109582261 [Amphimedon queenslandica]|eukprot:XP_019852472.1 PREDICTED: uncharacterized protein LOC109582261 [Amphimedon queenslandica]